MILYKLYSTNIGGEPNAAACVLSNGASISFIFDKSNTDYQQFKAQILNDEAELQDADGVLMSPEEAKAFVKELP